MRDFKTIKRLQECDLTDEELAFLNDYFNDLKTDEIIEKGRDNYGRKY